MEKRLDGSKAKKAKKVGKVKARRKEIIARLEKTPLAIDELRNIFGVCRKTIFRDLKALKNEGYHMDYHLDNGESRIYLDGRRSMVDPDQAQAQAQGNASKREEARLFNLIWVVYLHKRVSKDVLEKAYLEKTCQLYGDEIYTGARHIVRDDRRVAYSRRCLERSLQPLLEAGYIKKEIRPEGQFFVPGELMLPRITLTGRQVSFLKGLIHRYTQVYPERRIPTTVLTKLLAAYPEREEYAPDRILLEKILTRIAYKGRAYGGDDPYPGRHEKLAEAIYSRQKVKIEYFKEGQGEKNIMTVSPLQVCYNRQNDRWYLMVMELDKYGQAQPLRMDRIGKIVLTGSTFNYPRGYEPRAYPYPWGVGTGKPERVRVRFKKEFNIEEKVKGALANRPRAELSQGEGYLEMVDQVSGLPGFSRWLRQFGTYAEVLEPEGLRKSFLRAARRTLDVYGAKDHDGEGGGGRDATG